MDSSDFLVRISNDFYLGNYFDVLDGFKDFSESSAFNKNRTISFQILIFVQKAVIHSMRNCEQEIQKYQSILKGHIALLELFLKYFAPTLLNLPEEEAQSLLAELEVQPKIADFSEPEFVEVKNILRNSIYVATNKFTKFSKISAVYRELALEYQGMVFEAFETNLQRKEAEKLLDDLRIENDEHILVNLLWIQKEMRKQRFQQAIEKISEVKEKFGDSVKLNNFKACCLVGLLRFEEVCW